MKHSNLPNNSHLSLYLHDKWVEKALREMVPIASLPEVVVTEEDFCIHEHTPKDPWRAGISSSSLPYVQG